MNPDTIRNQRFLLVRRGYDPDAVVAFLDEVADALEHARASSDDPDAAALELADADRLVDEARTRAATQRLRAQRDIEALQRTARARRARLVVEIEELALARDQLAQDLDRAAEVVDRVVSWVRRTDPAAPPVPPTAVAGAGDQDDDVATLSVDHDEPVSTDESTVPDEHDPDEHDPDEHDPDEHEPDEHEPEPDGDEPHGHEADGHEPEGDAPDGDAPDGDGPQGDAPDHEVDDDPVVAGAVGDDGDGPASDDRAPDAVARDTDVEAVEEVPGVERVDPALVDDPTDDDAADVDVAVDPATEDVDAPDDVEEEVTDPAAGDVRTALRAVQDDVLGRLRDQPRGDVGDWMPAMTMLLALDDAAAPAAGRAFLDGWHAASPPADDPADDGLEVVADSAGDAVARDALEDLRGSGRLPGLGLAEDLSLAIRASLERGVDAGDAGPLLVERVAEVHRDVRQTLLPAALGHVLGAAHHHGLVSRWRHDGVPAVAWVLGEEQRCPGRRCRANASDGVVHPGETFAFGEVVPPAHAGCTCTLRPATPDEVDARG